MSDEIIDSIRNYPIVDFMITIQNYPVIAFIIMMFVELEINFLFVRFSWQLHTEIVMKYENKLTDTLLCNRHKTNVCL